MSRRLGVASLAALLAIAFPVAAEEAQADATTSYTAPPLALDLSTLKRLADLAMEARYDVSRAAAVEDFELARDTGSVHMSKGWVFLKEPVEGLVSEAVYFGEARYRLEAPIEMEAEQIERFLGSRKADVAIERADFTFTSLALQNRFQALHYSEEEARKARAEIKACEEWAAGVEKDTGRRESSEAEQRRRFAALQVAAGLYERLLDIDQEGELQVGMRVKVGEEVDTSRAHLDRLQWAVDPDEYEEVGLAARYDHGRNQYWSQVASFALSDQYRGRFQYAATSPSLEKKRTGEVVSRRNELVLDIDPGGEKDLDMTARLQLEVLAPEVKAFYMGITPYIHATSMSLDGKPVDFLQPKIPGTAGLYAPWIGVLLPEAAKAGDELALSVQLEGRLLSKIDGFTFVVREMDRWYPKPGSATNAPALFDTTMVLPKDFQGLSNGALTDCRPEDVVAGRECVRYVTKHPIDLAFVNLGKRMKVDEGIAPNGAKTLVQTWTNPNSPVSFNWFNGEGAAQSAQFHLSKTGPAITNKARVALAVYEDWFGPFPYAKFAITPHERSLGRGGASMLLLWKLAFLSQVDAIEVAPGLVSRPWWVDAFVAHETAHQWWGNIVGIRGDRDQWFSEGFADYASLIYLEYVDAANGTDYRSKELEEWYEKLTKDDGYIHDIVPLCLGNRHSSSENRSGYENRRQDFMYNKGGFVMHMLRTYARQVTGDKEKGDALFRAAIRSFIDEYYLKYPSNLDMQKSLSRSFGTDLSWFFKQWVYGMGIPKLEFSYQLARHSDGGTLLKGRIHQRQEGEPFRFPVAVYVHAGKGKSAQEAHFYQWIDARDAEFEVGPLPWRPEEVSLNDDRGLLGIVEEKDWSATATGQ